MPMKSILASALLWTAGAAAVSPASAAIISLALNFNASGFFPSAPVDPVEGSISVTFDDAADVVPATTTGIGATSFNFLVASPVVFVYDQSEDLIRFGGEALGVGAQDSTDFDFSLTIRNVSTTPQLDVFSYTFGVANEFSGLTSNGSVEVGPFQPLPVSEPLTLSLFGAGLIGLALARRVRAESAPRLMARA